MDTFVLHAAAPAHPCLILTTALAYSNARLHLGHALEALLADAFARHRRAWGQDVVFLGGDDNHGTATELRAQARGTTPEALVEEVYTHNTVEKLKKAHQQAHPRGGATSTRTNENVKP